MPPERTPMADETPTVKQEEIEDLLRQAQVASGLNPDSATVPAAAGPASASTQPPSASATAQTATLEMPRATFSPATANNNVGDDVQFLLNQAQQAIASVEQPVQAGLNGLAPFELKDLAGA